MSTIGLATMHDQKHSDHLPLIFHAVDDTPVANAVPPLSDQWPFQPPDVRMSVRILSQLVETAIELSGEGLGGSFVKRPRVSCQSNSTIAADVLEANHIATLGLRYGALESLSKAQNG